MNTYKKRAKGNWNQGKGQKGDSEERMYAKKEVAEEVKANDEDYLTPHKGKRKKNPKARLEYLINWYTQKVEEYDRKGNKNGLHGYFWQTLRKLKKEYEEKYGQKN